MTNTFTGTSGNDVLTGTDGGDTFQVWQGGDDTVSGEGGNDLIEFAGTFTAADKVDGGDGTDSIHLNGDYSAGVTLASDTITSVESIVMGAGNSYKLTTVDGNVAAGATLLINAEALGAGNTLTFNGSAELDGAFVVDGGAGNDMVTGGAGADQFNMTLGGEDTIQGGGGNDIVNMGASLDAGDRIDGGAGTNNILRLKGDYSAGVTFAPTTIANIENFQFANGFSYNLTVDAANFAANGPIILVNGSTIGASWSLDFNASASSANFRILGSVGNDVLVGGSGADNFQLNNGGEDSASGGAGNDQFFMGGKLDAGDRIDGGTGNDTIELSGNYAQKLTLSDSTFVNVETLLLDAGHSYNLKLADGNVAAGQTLLVNGWAVGAGNVITFDGSAETDGHFEIRGGAGNDVLTGGAQSDTFDLTKGGNDTVHGGAGDDVIEPGAALTAADCIDGGTGNDTLTLNGDYSAGIVFGAKTVTNVETIRLVAGNSYNLTTNDATVAAGAMLTVYAKGLGAANSLTFNGSAETDGTFDVIGGAGNDAITGGAGADIIDLTAGGTDTVHGGGGNDTIDVNAANVSADTIDGGAGSDTIAITGSGAVTLSDAKITNVETVSFADSGSYAVAVTGDITSGNGALTINASALTASHSASVDMSAATSTVNFTGGAGNDTVIFSSDNDNWGTVNGGGGNNTFEFNDGTAAIVSGASVTNFSTLSFADGHDYSGIYVTGDITGDNGTLNVDASAVSSGHTVDVDLSGVTSSGIDFTGGAGDDTVIFGSNIVNALAVNGGGGNNTLGLNGNGNDVNVNLYDSTVQNIENIALTDGNNYNVTINGDITSGQGTLTIDAGALSSAYGANLGLNSVTTSVIDVTGGAGNDVVSVWASDVTVDFSHGGEDTFYGGPGNALIEMGGTLDAGDQIYGLGGPGTLIVSLDGDYSAGITLSMLSAVNEVELGSGYNYNITLDPSDSNGFLLDGSSLGAGDSLTADASPVTSGDVTIDGGAGNDTITVGSASGGISAGAGDDTIIDNGFLGSIDGGVGNDTLVLNGGGRDLAATLSDSSISNIQNLSFDDGNNYDVIITGDITSGGGTLTIDAGALTATSAATVDLSGATTTAVNFTGGAGDDTVIFGTNIAAATSIDGGGGNDTLVLGQSGTLSGTVISHIENVGFSGDATSGYDVTIVGDLTSGGGTLSLDASQVQNGGVTFDLTGATTANFNILGSGGDDTVILGPGENLANFNAYGAIDTLELSGGSTGLTLDAVTIQGFSDLTFADGASYTGIVLIGDITNNTGPLTIDASALTGSNSVDVDASQAASSLYFVTGGAGDDTFVFGSNVGSLYSLDGGGGTNTLELNGHGSDVNANLYDSAVQNIENIVLDDGNNYGIGISGDIASGYGTLSIDASALSSAYGANISLGGATTAAVHVTGGAGDDTVSAGASDITVDFTLGGNDTFNGGWGSSLVNMGGALTADDSINGAQTVSLDGDYSAGLTLSATTLTSVGTLSFAAGHDYNLTTDDANVGAGQTLTVDGSALGAGDTLTFNGAAETDGSFAMIGGAGNDTLTGGAQADTFDLTHGGADTVHGGGGDDIITVKAADIAGDTIDGGSGNDTLVISDASNVTLSDTNISNIQNVSLADGDSYSVILTGDITSGGAALNIDASALSGTNAVTVDASNATTTAVDFVGGAGDDTITLSGYYGNIGTIDGGAGNNTLADAGGGTLSDTTVSHIDNVVYSNYGYGAGLTVTGDITSGGGTLNIDASTVNDSVENFVDVTGATTAVINFTGETGSDTITFGTNFSASDVIDGGGGFDTLQFDGNGTDVTATIADSHVSNFDDIALYDGNNYDLTISGDITSGAGALTVQANGLTGSNALTLDLTAATTASISVTGGAGNDIISTGDPTNGTYVDLSQGGNDTFVGGAGANTIYMGDTLDANDSITGGSGTNYLVLEGDSYSSGFALDAGMLHNINYVKLLGDHTYVLTGDPASLNSGAALTVDGGAMTGGSLQFDGSAVTDGTFSLYGGAGDDILKGGSGNDTLDLSVGGEDQLAGNGGNDIINAGGGLDAGDQVDGGAGSDTLNFNGDYSGGLVLGATTVVNVETFHFAAGYSYNITTNDATVAAGATLTVNASTLGASDQLIFNGSAETDGSFVITGGAGNDVLTGGAGNDIFHLGSGGDDTVQGGAGNDVIYGEAGYSSGDTIDGGTGTNNFWLGGKDYTGASAVTFTATNFLNIQTIDLNSSHNYSLTMNDANVAAGATMEVDGHLAKSFTFDGSAETDGHFTIVASTGADVLAGGALSDTFVFDAVNYSTSTTYDAITNLNFSSDILELNAGAYAPTGIDAAVTTGSLSTATFNSDLTSDLSGLLAAHHAVLFTASAGTLSGHTFLVVDANGTAGYQASADYVIDVTGYSGTLTTGSFT